jgi:cell shape-determining protein MreC
MKTNYLQRSKSGKPLKWIASIIVVFILGSVLFSFTGNFFLNLAKPLWQGENLFARRASTVIGYFSSKNSLIKENTELKEKLEIAEELAASARAFKDREAELLRTLGRPENRGSLSAAVLVHPPQSPYDTLVIDVGEKDGVRVGSRVYTGSSAAIGEVMEVTNNISKIKLFSMSGENTSAILERGSLPVTLQGHGGGNFKTSLPRDTQVEVGDRVTLPNFTSELIGIVGDIRLSPTDSTKEVLVRSPINIHEIRFVIIK